MMWLLPVLTKKVTYKPYRYPFVYYSTVLGELAAIDYANKEFPMADRDGNRYTAAQMDSLIPMLSYRQLMSDGRMPDSIKGYEVNARIIRTKSFTFRYDPAEINSPGNGLYILFESMPKRVGLTMPDDVFRMKNNIEFIDTETNTVNATKSAMFRDELEKKGYSFPSHWLVGNPNPRKAYDEGYFCLDNNWQLFHMKMVNGRPFVRNTGIGDSIDIAHFSILEVPDKRFYGFLFSKQGEMYIIQNEAGNYQTMKLDMDPIDMNTDQVIIMGNMFEWTVSVIKPDRKVCYGLDNVSLSRIDQLAMNRAPGKWDVAAEWLFPFYVSFDNKNTDYVAPVFHFTGLYAMVLNILLAVCGGIFFTNITRRRIFTVVFILITGIAGFVAMLVLPKYRKN